MEEDLSRSRRNRRVPDRYSPLPFKTTTEKNKAEYKEQSSDDSNKNIKTSDNHSESAEQIEDIRSGAQDFYDTESSIDYPEATDYNLDFPFDTEFIMESVENATVMSMRSVSMVRLTKWQDYPLWFDQIKLWARKHEIWDMVDPSIKEPQLYPVRPSIPGEPIDISDAEQRAIWQIRNSVSQQKRQEWHRIQSTLDRFNDLRLSSVDTQFHVNFMGKETERERLQALEASIKPTDIAIKTDLRAEYALLCKTPYGKDRQGYFDRWSGFEQWMRSNPIFATGESEAIHSLITSLQPLYPTTAIFRKNKVNDKINEGEDAKLKDEIRAWTTLLQQEGVERFPNNNKIASADKTALSASFQGKSQYPQSGNQDGRPSCPCGLTHWPSQCYYLNPERRRKPNWKMNKETAKKVKLFLQKNPKFAAEVDEAIKKWEDSAL